MSMWQSHFNIYHQVTDNIVDTHANSLMSALEIPEYRAIRILYTLTSYSLTFL